MVIDPASGCDPRPGIDGRRLAGDAPPAAGGNLVPGELAADVPGHGRAATDELSLVSSGERKVSKPRFRFSGATQEAQCSPRELSNGQRAIIAPRTLLHCLPEQGAALCVDEPENFLALPEIQPWLDALYDRVEDERPRALLVSHHPRLINRLAEDAGSCNANPILSTLYARHSG